MVIKMKTIVIDKETKLIIEVRDYARWNYSEISEGCEEIQHKCDFSIEDIPLYFINGEVIEKPDELLSAF